MSEGPNTTKYEDYKRYVYTSRRQWWNPLYRDGARLDHALSFVVRDLEGIIGKKLPQN